MCKSYASHKQVICKSSASHRQIIGNSYAKHCFHVVCLSLPVFQGIVYMYVLTFVMCKSYESHKHVICKSSASHLQVICKSYAKLCFHVDCLSLPVFQGIVFLKYVPTYIQFFKASKSCASNVQLLCKSCASHMHVIYNSHASHRQVVCKSYASRMQVVCKS